MIFICPSCGVRLEKDFKFCPNCGFDLSSPVENEETTNGNGHNSVEDSGIVVCENCGEENNSANDFCSNCGVKLPQKKDVKKTSAEKIPVQQEKRKTQHKNQSSVKAAAPVKAQPRSLSSKQILIIVGASAAIIAMILFVSGVFDSVPVPPPAVSDQTVPGTQPPGVDLSLMPEINSLEERIKANPGDQEALLQLAHLQNDARLYERAIQSYRKYLENNPSNADARVDMGVCYYNLQDYNTAIAEMTKALEYKPGHQIAHLNLGIVNLTAGNLESSKEWLRKAVEIDPNSEVGKRAKELLETH